MTISHEPETTDSDVKSSQTGAAWNGRRLGDLLLAYAPALLALLVQGFMLLLMVKALLMLDQAQTRWNNDQQTLVVDKAKAEIEARSDELKQQIVSLGNLVSKQDQINEQYKALPGITHDLSELRAQLKESLIKGPPRMVVILGRNQNIETWPPLLASLKKNTTTPKGLYQFDSNNIPQPKQAEGFQPDSDFKGSDILAGRELLFVLGPEEAKWMPSIVPEDKPEKAHAILVDVDQATLDRWIEFCSKRGGWAIRLKSDPPMPEIPPLPGDVKPGEHPAGTRPVSPVVAPTPSPPKERETTQQKKQSRP